MDPGGPAHRDAGRYPVTRPALAVAGPLLVAVLALAGCASAPVAGSPSAPAPGPPTAGPPAVVHDGCALLAPADVERITGRSPVTEVPSGTDRTSDFQGCFYSDDAQTFLTASFARGLVGNDGQAAAASFGGRRAAAGSTEPVPDIGAGAVFFRGPGGEDGVVVAFDAGGGDLVMVTVEGRCRGRHWSSSHARSTAVCDQPDVLHCCPDSRGCCRVMGSPDAPSAGGTT